MDSLQTDIESYYESRGLDCSEQSFLQVNPNNSYKYLFSPCITGTSLLADRIDGPRWSQQLISNVVRVGKYAPSTLSILPDIKKTQISVPGTNTFSLAIEATRTSSRQITLLSPSAKKIETLGLDGDTRVLKEITTRQSLPDEINIPKLLEVNTEFPYFISEFVQGRTIQDPVRDWEFVLDALTQLRTLYEAEAQSWVESTEAVEQLFASFENSTDDHVIQRGLEQLAAGPLPDAFLRSLTHGDLHGQNLLVSDGSVYLLDWEHTKEVFVIRDFFTPFLLWDNDNRKRRIFKELFYSYGRGGHIGQKYAHTIGPIAWGSQEWTPEIVLFGLFQEMARLPQTNSKWQTAYELSSMLLE